MSLQIILSILVICIIVYLFLGYTQERFHRTLKEELFAHKKNIEDSIYKEHIATETKYERTQTTLTDVLKTLTEVKESNKRIHDIGKDISTLTQVLSHPKLRGSLGEYLLEEILSTALPKEFLSFQHRFPTGTIVDAALLLRDKKILSIDAKFPFAAFQKALDTENEQNREQHIKILMRDVKKHIDAIQEKYILPELGTLDVAFMYIPSEAVAHFLYQYDQEHEIVQYALQKKVIPVSPVTLFGYLQVILMGMQGFEIEAKAQHIMTHLAGIERQLHLFTDDFEKLGKHLSNAQQTYTEAHKKKLTMQHKLDALTSSNQATSIVEIENVHS